MKDPDLCSPSERISDYAKRRKELRGLSTDEIHGIDSQPNGGYELRFSDIEWQSKRIAELEAQAKASEWQPIETAPKDGTVVMLYGQWAGEINGVNKHPSIDIGRWTGGSSDYPGEEWWGLITGDVYVCWMIPIYWKPLPAPPKSTCESA